MRYDNKAVCPQIKRENSKPRKDPSMVSKGSYAEKEISLRVLEGGINRQFLLKIVIPREVYKLYGKFKGLSLL